MELAGEKPLRQGLFSIFYTSGMLSDRETFSGKLTVPLGERHVSEHQHLVYHAFLSDDIQRFTSIPVMLEPPSLLL